MCLYVSPLLSMASVPSTIAPTPAAEEAAPLLHLPYDSSTNYALAANQVPNGKYAINPPHPSELVVGELEPEVAFHRTPIMFKDSTVDLGANLSAIVTTDSDDFFVGAATQSHHYAYGTCENIGACAVAGALVGSPCTGYSRGVASAGFCYKSSIGTLECGRTLDVQSRFSDAAPVALKYGLNEAISRCPSGTPLAATGKKTVRMLLLGGCMVASDASYNPEAMIHIPSQCSTTTDSVPGCIFPGARNYNPGANQPTKCLYSLNGCTSPTALNYNSEASVDDGSCVQPSPGCTLSAESYSGVDSGTPKYKELYGSKPLVNVGRITYASYGNVLNPTAGANVLTSCTIAIEGCMDASAANYDAAATVNTNTWCVPKVYGCMMPAQAKLSASTAALADRVHTKDGGAFNYSAAATVNVPAYCGVGRYGCTVAGSMNYDATASIDDGSCYTKDLLGCLDKAALNFNCTSLSFYAECSHDSKLTVPTKHNDDVCQYTYSPPPAPSPAIPPGVATRETVEVSFVAAGTVSDFDDTKKDAIATIFATKLNITTDAIRILVEAASVKITAEIDAAVAGKEPDEMKTAIASEMGSAEAATSFLSSAGVDVISTPVIETKIKPVIAPPAPPPAAEVGGIIGGIAGGIGGALMLIGIGAGINNMRKKNKATYPA